VDVAGIVGVGVLIAKGVSVGVAVGMSVSVGVIIGVSIGSAQMIVASAENVTKSFVVRTEISTPEITPGTSPALSTDVIVSGLIASPFHHHVSPFST
jgi:hypothetical protein